MRKYTGDGAYIPGVPARDLSEAEWREHVAAGRIVETVEVTDDEGKTKTVPGPAMALYTKTKDPPAGAAGDGAQEGGEG
jgi:hypothetical protein